MDSDRRRVAFDRFSLDVRARELSYGARCVRLQEKPFRLLLALLAQPNQVVPRQELSDALWPLEHVEREAGLNTAVRKLRAALRQAADWDAEVIETVPRVGYRIRVPQTGSPGRAEHRLLQARRATRWRPADRWAATALLVAATALLTQATEPGPGRDEPMPEQPAMRALYVEARGLLAAGEDLSRARQLLRTLIEQAPEFAPGHSHLAEASARVALRTGDAGDVGAAREATARALARESASTIPHRTAAMLALHFDRDPVAAAAHQRRALQRGPDDPVTYLTQATYESVLGRHEAALAAVRRAVDLAPETMSIRSDAGYFMLRAGRYSEAATECEMVLRLDADNRFGLDCLITARALDGDADAARPPALRAMQLAGAPASAVQGVRTAADPRRAYVAWSLQRLLDSSMPPPIQIAAHHLVLGQHEAALDWLEQGAVATPHDLIYVPGSATFEPLRGEERYERLLRRLRIETFATS